MVGSRRHRPPNPPLTAATANPNAAMAAAAVFKKHEQQKPTLSAAAAAAALRSRPMTPTNVAEVQTKRTQRRSASISSAGRNVLDSQDRPGLQRRSSSASMTERTFRTPSPGGSRRGSISGDGQASAPGYAHHQEPPPPVPPIPKNIGTQGAKSDRGHGQHRKAQSLNLTNPPFRVASQKLDQSGAPSWYTGAHVGDLSNVRTSDAAMASPPLSPAPRLAHYDEDERPDSRSSSVNFSYPSRLRVGSPASPTATGGFESSQDSPATDRGARRTPSVDSSVRGRSASASAVESLVYDPNSRRMVPRVDTYAAEQNYQRPAGRSMRKKKSKPAPKTGSHLSQGTMGRTKTAPMAAAYVAAVGHEAAPEHQPRYVDAEMPTSEAPRTRRAPNEDGSMQERRHEPEHAQATAYVEDQPYREAPIRETPSTNAPADTQEVPYTADAQDEEPAVKSLITGPRSDETKAQQQHPVDPTSSSSLSVPAPRERFVGDGLRRQPSVVREEPELEEEGVHTGVAPTVSAALDAIPTRQKAYGMQPQETQAQPHEAAPVSKPRAVSLQPPPRITGVQRERSLSISPARTARFGGVQGNLSVKHSPPARSLSPRKSALKQSASPSRGASPDDSVSETSSGANRRDEGPPGRKKPARVSFDDGNTIVVGQTPSPDRNMGDSPKTSGAQQGTRRPWYSNIGRSKKQEFVPLDDDEIMQPRPELPSFGSVRDKKPRETTTGQEGRPLVRPTSEPVNNSPSLPPSPELLPAVAHVSGELESETRAISLGTGGSYSTGVSLAEPDRAKIPANTSRFREPLPPVVTSMEGSGYVSDSSTSSGAGNEAPLARTASPIEGDRFSTPEPLVQKQEMGGAGLMAAQHLNVPIVPEADAPPPSTTAMGLENVSGQEVPPVSISQPTSNAPEWPATQYLLGVPGGFPDEDSDATPQTPQELAGNPAGPVPAMAANEDAPARYGAFEPVTQPADSLQTAHTPGTVTATLIPVTEEDDDTGDSVYSDANEHFTDTDEGFLSLDAVVGRSAGEVGGREPVTELASSQAAADTRRFEVQSNTLPRSVQDEYAPFPAQLSTATTVVESQPGEPSQQDWEKAKSYWRSLTEEKRAQLEREAVDDAGAEGDLEESNQATAKSKKKKSPERRTSERQELAVHMAQQTMASQQAEEYQGVAEAAVTEAPVAKIPSPERTYQIKPGTKADSDHATPRTRANANGEPNRPSKVSDAGPRIRKSMRTNGSTSVAPEQEHSMRGSMAGRTLRSGPGSQPVSETRSTKAARRVSAPPLPTGAASAAMNTARNSVAMTPLQRRDSTDSDSSFKRARPGSSSGFGFRKTLRQPSQSPAPNRELAGRPASSRFSLRSVSPTGSHRNYASSISSPKSMGMRNTLRGSPKEAKGSSGGLNFGGFGKSSSKGAKKAGSRSSRFGDSSDEDDEPRSMEKFRSRFEDSSDEDEVRPLPSLSKSLPKTMRSGKQAEADDWAKPAVRRFPAPKDSPVLREEEEDSSDEDPYVDEDKRGAVSTPQGKTSTSGHDGSFNSPAVATPKSAGEAGAKPSTSRRGSFMSVLRRKKNKTSDEMARSNEPETAHQNGVNHDTEDAAAVRPRSPRVLTKRSGGFPIDAVVASPGAENWPLPASPDLERPSTSGNLGTRTMSNNSTRPTQGRSMSANMLAADSRKTASEGGGEKKKKKKFGGLRKMFGLSD